MLITGKRSARLLIATAAMAVLAPACSPLGAMDGRGMPAPRTSVVQGEVRSVDQRQNRMQIRERNGRNHVVEFDRRTVVVGNQRQQRVTALRRGDFVRVSMRSGYGRYPVAERVEVRNRSGDRGRATAVRVERIDGTVGRIDVRRGTFTVDRGRNSSITVHLPARLQQSDARRFERLRRGDRVRVDVRMAPRNHAEFVRFR